jgi:hypothetical protein
MLAAAVLLASGNAQRAGNICMCLLLCCRRGAKGQDEPAALAPFQDGNGAHGGEQQAAAAAALVVAVAGAQLRLDSCSSRVQESCRQL